MATARDILLQPIDSRSANAFVRRVHYSGKVVNNSQLHLGVFMGDKLEGVMQFGPPLDKRKIQGLVAGTLWHEFLELNRMAFSDNLPRNSESRAIAVAMRLIHQYAPQIKWIVSFADATQCGDGTIYRASGFVLTQINPNQSSIILPSGQVVNQVSITDNGTKHARRSLENEFGQKFNGAASVKKALELGARRLEGFQLRYIYFLDPAYRARLTVPELPYSEIEKRGAGMYKGIKRVRSEDSGTAGDQPAGGGASPTRTL